MNKIIKTGEWDGQDIWREQTSVEKLSEALNKMSLKNNDEFNEELREQRIEWLGGTKEEEILTDDEGKEYILEEIENGTAGDDGYEVRSEKRYLPDNLQASNFLK